MASTRRPTAKKRPSKPTWRKVKAVNRSAKVSSAVALRHFQSALASAAVARTVHGGATKPFELPPQAVAQMAGLVAAFVAGVKKGYACAAGQAALDAINDALDKGAGILSDGEKADLKKLGDEAWGNMVALGC
jgi:hypothetical protein